MADLLHSFIDYMIEGGIAKLLFRWLIPSLSAVAGYLLLGAALTVLVRGTGMGRGWMAWVPFARLYLLGLLADGYTDHRLTHRADRADPFYRPSDLRRRMLGYGIGSGIAGMAAAVGWTLFLTGGAIVFFLTLGMLVGGEPPAETPPLSGALVGIGALMGFVAGIFFLVFAVLFLLAACPAVHRILTALGAPVPALWVVLGIFLPLAAVVALWILVRRKRADLASCFGPVGAEEREAPDPDPIS